MGKIEKVFAWLPQKVCLNYQDYRFATAFLQNYWVYNNIKFYWEQDAIDMQSEDLKKDLLQQIKEIQNN